MLTNLLLLCISSAWNSKATNSRRNYPNTLYHPPNRPLMASRSAGLGQQRNWVVSVLYPVHTAQPRYDKIVMLGDVNWVGNNLSTFRVIVQFAPLTQCDKTVLSIRVRRCELGITFLCFSCLWSSSLQHWGYVILVANLSCCIHTLRVLVIQLSRYAYF